MSRWAELRLALRLLWREARSGELTLIVTALLLAVVATTTIAVFSARLDAAMQYRANDVLGADMRVRSATPIPPEWQQQADALGLQHTRTLSFASVVLHDEAMNLAAIKAVDEGYPMRGRLRVTDRADDEQGTLRQQGPQSGEAWLEPRLMALLGVQLGDEVEVGRLALRIVGVLLEESDRSGNFYSFNPRLMMNWHDIAASGLTEAGSRLNYRLLLQGNDTALQQLQNSLVLEPNQQIETIQDSNQALSNALEKARQYLSLAALLAVVLASVAVAISAQSYAQRHYDISALMRTFGLAQAQITRIYTEQLLILAVLAMVAGAVLAFSLQAALIWLLQDVLPKQLPHAPWQAWLLGTSSAGITLLGFALPHLYPLARVSPLRVLRRDLTPVPLQGWVLSAVAMLALTGLLWLFTGDVVMSVGVMLGGALVLLLLLTLLTFGIGRWRQRLQQRDLPLTRRFAWQRLTRNGRQTAGQILALALTLMIMVVIANLRHDLLADWQASLPDDAPNVFAVNIQPYEKAQFEQSLDEAGWARQTLYPVYPSRLIAVNERTVEEHGISEDPAVNRDLIITSVTELPKGNRVESGRWQALQEAGQVSVEARLAQRLNIALGDTLHIRSAGQDQYVTVSSLRSIDWSSLSPNFYFIFSPDVAATLHPNYMTSFHVPSEQQAQLTQLIRSYPGVTLLDTQAIIEQIQGVLQQVTLAIELILLLVLIAAVLVLVAALLASLPGRLREGAMLRTLGAGRTLIQQAQRSELTLLALMSSGLALIGAELMMAGVYQGVLNIPYQPFGWHWLVLPLITVLLLWGIGRVLMRPVLTVSPLHVLRDNRS
ncbi:MAG: ABC transporter permease [Bacterioplanes sp.]|nr:ABC transporter permease [Bacterioplanes sp.]